MLIELTRKCHEGCTHCMVDACPDGLDMDQMTLDKTCRFIKDMAPPTVQITGGEFTDHPNFYPYVLTILNTVEPGTIVVLESNGSFIMDDENTSKVLDLLRRNVYFLQIRTHKLYYPNYERTMAHKQMLESLSDKIKVYDDGITLFPQGRAKENFKDECNACQSKPKCSNLYLIAKQAKPKSLKDVIYILQKEAHNFCKPMIGPDGNIYPGESPECEPIGNLDGKYDDILQKLITGYPCNKCGMAKNYKYEKKYLVKS